jgi:regulator of replication initiation timing
MMRKLVRTGLLLAVGIASVITLVAGCTEERQSDTKSIIAKTRLEANEKDAENRRLRKEIKDLKALHKKEFKKQEKALAKCLRTKKSLEELSDKGFDEYMRNILGPLVDENARLQEENENLKAEIGRLKKQLEELRKRPTITS